MDTYSFLRELADSWALLVLTLIFLFVIAWAFRPGSRALHDDAAAVPFRETAPGRCTNACPDCTCAMSDFMKERDHA